MVLTGAGLLFPPVIAESIFLFQIGSGVPPKCQQESGVVSSWRQCFVAV